MASYPLKCPFCEHIADSMDSLSDTKAELRSHIQGQHRDVEVGVHVVRPATRVLPSIEHTEKSEDVFEATMRASLINRDSTNSTARVVWRKITPWKEL